MNAAAVQLLDALPPGPPRRILVAMSGGVDSSVAAALLKDAGHEVIGCFMRLGSPGESIDHPTPTRIGHQGCCSITDAADARAVAGQLGIPFYVCNFKRDFARIIDYFADEYVAGRTPNPCVRCNDWLKFGKLHEYARSLGADAVASGHYARVDHSTGTPRLMRGLDARKDQSYVLFGVPRETLGEMILPIGGMHKDQVRDVARAFGLPVFDKPDSQEICFVPDNDYAGLVDRLRPGVARAGEIVDAEGTAIGTHAGQHRFTIGQRRGVSVSLGHAVYVVSRDARANRVVVGEKEDLLAEMCVAGEANWLVDPPSRAESWRAVWAKYRYNTPAARARVRVVDDARAATPSGRLGRFEVKFDEAQVAIAPGQAVVLYDGDEPDWVVGGGWIESVGERVDGASSVDRALTREGAET
ncbi:MAG: tRNA 2-thiouridine(34) synthase MnmA [Phycisphaerales bacterium]